MSLSNDGNKYFQHIKKEPSYTNKEFQNVSAYLKEEGFTNIRDLNQLGVRFFKKNDGSQDEVAIYLNELNCHDTNSGVMLVTRNNGTQVSAIYKFLKDENIRKTKNPIKRFFKRAFL